MRTFIAAALFASLASAAWAQPAMSDFNPGNELQRLEQMPAGYQRVQRFFYLGELTSRSGEQPVARQAFQKALLTFDGLDGDHRTLGVTYASHAALGLAGLTHLEFRDIPLGWETYSPDSAQRWELQRQAREEYARVANIGYARATFEALFLRARVLEEWDVGELDVIAERDAGTGALARVIRHLNLSAQMLDQAKSEYERMIVLEDSLGFADGVGDEDVDEWMREARERLEKIPDARSALVAREEALQALYLEQQAAEWSGKAIPLLWEQAANLTEQDARMADPFFDFTLEQKLVNEAFRPFIYGPHGFYAAHGKATAAARSVRPETWVGQRLQWQRRQDWLDAGISRRLARDGLRQLGRAAAMLDTAAQKASAVADTLPAEWKTALSGVPDVPPVPMPEIPDFSEWDPHWRKVTDERADSVRLDEYMAFKTRMTQVHTEVGAFEERIADFTSLVGGLIEDADDLPQGVRDYKKLRRGIAASQTVLLDTLRAIIVRQVGQALEQSRAAAVWLPAGTESFSVGQTITDYVAASAGRIRAIAANARSEADRHRTAANQASPAPPANELLGIADALAAFSDRLEEAASALESSRESTAGGS